MSDLPVQFEHRCATAADFARRYRVLAAMSDGKVQFTWSPDELRALAQVLDDVAQRPVLVFEVERPMSAAMAVWMTFILSLGVAGCVGDIALALMNLLPGRAG